jgi:type III secretory pathway component EscS
MGSMWIEEGLRVLLLTLVIPLSISLCASFILSLIYAAFQLQDALLPLLVRVLGVLCGLALSRDVLLHEWSELFERVYSLLGSS